MKARDRQLVLRRPRHAASDVASLRVEIHRAEGESPRVLTGQLVDFSRMGAHCTLPLVLPIGEKAEMRLVREPDEVVLTREGEIRWNHRDENGNWSIGFQFTTPLDWESLGELFLVGVLTPAE
jgi:hypothetical protein